MTDDYEIVLRRKPVTDFDSIDDLQRWLIQQRAREMYEHERQQDNRNFAKDHSFEEWLQR